MKRNLNSLSNLETQLINPERISSKALRYLLGEVAIMATMSKDEQAEAVKAKIEYWLTLRDIDN